LEEVTAAYNAYQARNSLPEAASTVTVANNLCQSYLSVDATPFLHEDLPSIDCFMLARLTAALEEATATYDADQAFLVAHSIRKDSAAHSSRVPFQVVQRVQCSRTQFARGFKGVKRFVAVDMSQSSTSHVPRLMLLIPSVF
jgi:hypothetical protein